MQAPEAEFPDDQEIEVPMVEAPDTQFPISQEPQDVCIGIDENR